LTHRVPHRPPSHPGPIPILPLLDPDTKGEFSTANPPNMHIFGTVGRKPELPGGKPTQTRGRMCKLHTDPSRESNPSPWRYEAAVLTSVIPCRPWCCETSFCYMTSLTFNLSDLPPSYLFLTFPLVPPHTPLPSPFSKQQKTTAFLSKEESYWT